MSGLLNQVEVSMMHRQTGSDEVRATGKGRLRAGSTVERRPGRWVSLGLTALVLAAAGMAAGVPGLLGLDGVGAQSASAALVVERPLAPVAATRNHAPYPLVAADEDGLVRFSVAEFADGVAHDYTFMVDGGPVEFFVVQDKDGAIRAAYNACDVCYRAKLGYTQDGRVMVCSNCGNRFPIEQINMVRGGCNPAPLERQLDGDALLIKAADLAAGLYYF
jgi:hypothetical protein